MKKSLLLLSVAAIAFSCAEVEEVTPTLNNEEKRITIEVGMPSHDATTRIAVSEDVETGNWVTAWKNTDKLAVYQSDVYNVVKLEIDKINSDKSASFSGSIARDDKPIRMIYPYQKFRFSGNTFPINLERQNVEINTLDNLGDYSYMINESLIEDPSTSIGNQQMVHLTTALELNLRFSNIESGTKAIISHITAGVEGVEGVEGESYVSIPSYAQIDLLEDATSNSIYSSTTNEAITIEPNSEFEIANYDSTSATEYSIPFNALPFDITPGQTLAFAVYVNYEAENGLTTSKKIMLTAKTKSDETVSFKAGTHTAINKIVDMLTATTNNDVEYVRTLIDEDFEEVTDKSIHVFPNEGQGHEIIQEDDNKILKIDSKQGPYSYVSKIHFQVAKDDNNLTVGATYELSFRIKSNIETTTDGGDFETINKEWTAAVNDKISISTEWSDVVIRATLPEGDFTSQARGISLYTGTSPDCTIYIDNVVLREVNSYYVDTSIKPFYWKEISIGGDFEGATHQSSAIYSASGEVITEEDGNKAYKVTASDKGEVNDNIWDGQFYFAKHDYITKGVKCKLSFKAKAENGCIITDMASQCKDALDKEAYDNGLTGKADITTDWKEFEFEYETKNDKVYAIKAPVGEIEDVIYFDNIKVSIWTNEE